MKPLLRGHFHQAMFFIALGGLIPLLLRCHNKLEYIAISIYSLCALAMFGISSLYHRIHWNPKQRLLWKKLDHAGIYLMIAGSVTPIALLGLGNPSSQKILFIFWGIALLGILQSLFFCEYAQTAECFFLSCGRLYDYALSYRNKPANWFTKYSLYYFRGYLLFPRCSLLWI